MRSFDFDFEVQKLFDNSFSEIKSTNWQEWLDLTTREEYEELALKNSGLSSVENLFEKIEKEKSSSTDLSIDLDQYISENQNSESLFICHSSGTTNSDLKALKWFHMSKEVVENQWAPGMQAIFESSGLNSKSSAVIFVPSRMKFDGIQINEEFKYVSLYSSEFSQRVMLSIIRPKSYLFYEYKDSKTLEIISKILSLEEISVVSAPAATILSWANLDKLKEGIKRTMTQKVQITNPILENLISITRKKDLSSACHIIQQRLSNKLSNATLVFSISSLSEKDWSLIRRFMNWQKGHERFTNLYVVSEIGPFAASITKGDFMISRSNKMYVFPLTIPVIEHNGKRELLTQTKNKIGKLLVSRLHNSEAVINIDLGDVISISNQEKLPLIEGKIIRSCFKLKYPIKITDEINLNSNYSIYAGDYFALKDFKIINPRKIINCLNMKCDLKSDSVLLINSNEHKWKLYLAPKVIDDCSNQNKMYNIILECTEYSELNKAIRNQLIKIISIKNPPIAFMAPRSEILTEVRNGKLPKGILKKWPLYLLRLKNED
ncbi:MAG: hypothetical protein ACFFA0_05050 [Promethearchaeota archaeon]